MREHVYLLTVSSVLALAIITASGQGHGPTSSAQGRAAVPALDPELTNYQYPHSVGFYELDTQGQRLCMAYMDAAAARPIALVNPIGLEDWKLLAPYGSVEENFAQELRATPESIKEYQRANYFGGEWKPGDDALTEILAGRTRHPYYRRVAWNAALTSNMIFTQPFLYEFERLNAPTQLIIGQRDRTAIGKERVPKEIAAAMCDYPAPGRAAALRIPRARLVEIGETGHLPQVDSFAKYVRAPLDFIAGLIQRSPELALGVML